jgi:hypothetical protein
MGIKLRIEPPDELTVRRLREAASKRGYKVVVAHGQALVVSRQPGWCADCGRWDSHLIAGLCAGDFKQRRNLKSEVNAARLGGGDLDSLDGGPDDQGPPPPPAA